MILVTTATEIEMVPLIKKWDQAGAPLSSFGIEPLIVGVGPAATSFSLTKRLSGASSNISLVLNFGVGGAYIQPRGILQPQLLDICLAEYEVFGDLGISVGDRFEYLDCELTGRLDIPMKGTELDRAETILRSSGIPTHRGTFVTVSSVSGKRKRGEQLRSRWNGLCENMEGASIAMVSREYGLPVVEIRAVSNYVEDRDTSSWKLLEACESAADAARLILEDVIKNDAKK